MPEERPFPTRRLSWSELVQLILVEKDFGQLRRCRQDEQVYQEYMTNHVRAQYNSVMDFILITKLNVPTIETDHSNDGKKRAAPLAQVIKDGEVRQALVRNDFPYYFATEVEHWILWKLGGGGISTQEIDAAKEDLREKLGDDVVDTLHWVNPPALKSIPEIDHVHILIRHGVDKEDE